MSYDLDPRSGRRAPGAGGNPDRQSRALPTTYVPGSLMASACGIQTLQTRSNYVPHVVLDSAELRP